MILSFLTTIAPTGTSPDSAAYKSYALLHPTSSVASHITLKETRRRSLDAGLERTGRFEPATPVPWTDAHPVSYECKNLRRERPNPRRVFGPYSLVGSAQPLGHLQDTKLGFFNPIRDSMSLKISTNQLREKVAEEVGFEPTEGITLNGFQMPPKSLDHSSVTRQQTPQSVIVRGLRTVKNKVNHHQVAMRSDPVFDATKAVIPPMWPALRG